MRPMQPKTTALLTASVIALSMVTLSLAGAANAQDRGPGGYGARERVEGLNQQVFFSPSGQPFRAPPGQPYPVVDWFNAADTNHDGKISHDEFVADAMKFFAVLDVNHDGYINSPENTRYENQIAPEILRIDPRIQQPTNYTSKPDSDMDPSASDDQGGSSGNDKYFKQIQGASQYGLIDEPQPIRAADANFDFRVSKDEWLAATNQRFNILDRNGDGFLTLDELPKTPAQLALEAPAKTEKGRGRKKHSED